MRDRTTLDQGLTINQIYCEVFPDIVEEYIHDTRSKEEKLIQLSHITKKDSVYWQDIHSTEIANDNVTSKRNSIRRLAFFSLHRYIE